MRFLMLMLMGLLTGCSGEGVATYGPQQWDETQFVVEARPAPVRAGMNEFIVIATREHSRPGVGYVVSLRIGESGEWRQAMQDGYTGVYRRSARVVDPAADVLQVQVKKSRSDAETVLYFPLDKKG